MKDTKREAPKGWTVTSNPITGDELTYKYAYGVRNGATVTIRYWLNAGSPLWHIAPLRLEIRLIDHGELTFYTVANVRRRSWAKLAETAGWLSEAWRLRGTNGDDTAKVA